MQIRSLFLLAAAGMCVSFAAGCLSRTDTTTPVTPVSRLLDGQAFAIRLIHGSRFYGNDTLKFNEGAFQTPGSVRVGFPRVAYRAESDGQVTTFAAEMDQENGDMRAWKGIARSGYIEGTLHLVEKGKSKSLVFSGSLK